jgi:arginase
VIAVLDAPSNLGLKRPQPDREPGVRYAPWQLRELGLLDRLNARDAGSVPAPAYTGERDPETGILHGQMLAGYAVALADAIGPVLASGDFPLVLGGDCSILLGSTLALARRGRHGLLFLDGHRDLLTPATSRSGGAAGMDLALATGHGPGAVVRIEGHQPLVAPRDVVLFGHRDGDDWYEPGLLALARDEMRQASLDDARSEEIPRALKSRLDGLLASGVDGFWIHVDVDVLDEDEMPAVDSPEPGGLRHAELAEILDLSIGTGRALGAHVTIYDPERDPDRRCGRLIVEALASGLRRLVEPRAESRPGRTESPD